MGVGTDYTKCFDLIPQAISIAMLDIQGMEKGVLRGFHGMYSQLQRVFKIGGCVVEGNEWDPPRMPAQRYSNQCTDVHMEEGDR